jgi:hypothetical protein
LVSLMGSLGPAFGKHMGSSLVIASDCLCFQISEGIPKMSMAYVRFDYS